MSIMNSLFSGASGLTHFGNAMSVISNNLANSNTTAFKGSRTTFEDTFFQTLKRNAAVGANQVGHGVALGRVSPNMTQGAFEQTGIATDLAIDGRGYFVVSDYSASSSGAHYFTRAGDFSISTANKLVNNQGFVLQGKKLDVDGDPIGTLADVDLNTYQTNPADATTTVQFSLALDAGVDRLDDGEYDPMDASTYQFSSTVRVIDSLGQGHNVELQFLKVDANTWKWHPVVDSSELATTSQDTTGREFTVVDDPNLDRVRSNIADQPDTALYEHGTLVFTASGALAGEGSVPITFNWGNGSAAQEIQFDFGGAVGWDVDGNGVVTTAADDTDSTADFGSTASIGSDVDGDGTIDDYVDLDGDGVQDSTDYLVLDMTSAASTAISQNVATVEPVDGTAFDPNNASSYQFEVQRTLTDSAGQSHTVALQFVKVDDYTWEWHTVATTSELASGYQDPLGASLTAVDDPDLDGVRSNVVSAPSDALYSHGTLHFTPAGFLASEGSAPVIFNWEYTDPLSGLTSTVPQTVLFDFGDAIGMEEANQDSTNDYSNYSKDEGSTDYLSFTSMALTADTDNTGTDATTQYAAGFLTKGIAQDGFGAGYLEAITFDENGKLYGSYTNGQVRAIYQLALATFANEGALEQMGGNLYRETFVSGQAVMGPPNTGMTGAIQSYALEQSNVDMADQFVDMITVQRGYQGNSRIISTTNSMLDDLMNIIR